MSERKTRDGRVMRDDEDACELCGTISTTARAVGDGYLCQPCYAEAWRHGDVRPIPPEAK